MLRFLFWNVNRKPLQAAIRRLVDQHDIDIVILAECTIPPAQLSLTLNLDTDRVFCRASPNGGLSEIYTRFMPDLLVPVVWGHPRCMIRRLALPAREEILLVVVHLVSKLYRSEDDQFEECIAFADQIRAAEKVAGHERTILVGDVNMFPFERGLVHARGLSAVMTREIAAKVGRTVADKDYPFFYNPMWGLLGDGNRGPAGTYYRRPKGHLGYYWYMFDQVLVRPALLDRFRNEDLEVLTTDGGEPLVTKRGLPDKRNASDHLPITFALHL